MNRLPLGIGALAALVFVVLPAFAQGQSNVTDWQPDDLAAALETVFYGTVVCDLALPDSSMTDSVERWGTDLGIGGLALASLMAEQNPMVRQMAKLQLSAFCSQAKAVAGQFGML